MGLVDLEPRPSPGQLLDGDPALHTGQRRTEATVDPIPEPECQARGPIDVEDVGIVVEALIP